MRYFAVCLRFGACFAACIALLCGTAVAQQGHPLVGTWSGDMDMNGQRQHVTIVMNWDGKTVSGLVNPGPDSFALSTIALDPTNWTVHMEGDTKGTKPAHISADGKIEDLGSYHRSISGSMTHGTAKATFKIVRD